MLPKLLLSAATLILLAGCDGAVRSVTLPVRGVAPMNTNDAKESLPVDVRVHPLSSDGRFRLATVEQIWTDPKAVLGPDLLAAPVPITVYPGTQADAMVATKFEFPGGTKYLGILAMYQGSEAQDRRALVVPVEEAERRGLVFTGYGVGLVPAPTEVAAPAPQPAASAPR